MKYLLYLFVFLSLSCAAPHGYSAEIIESTLADQTSVQVTVYNSNLGLVKDTREIVLAGEGELRFMDVASYINPVTVHAASISDPGDFTILEQNYEYDLMNEQKILDKYVGKTLKLYQWNEYQDRKEYVEAELIANNQGQIYKIGDEIYLGHPGIKILPEIPENLIEKPTLTWLYQSAQARKQEIEVSYLTGNISWSADYVVTLHADEKNLDLSGWVSVDNRSGAAYENAELKLVAGDVNRVQQKSRYAQPEMDMVMMSARAASPQFEEQAFFEYHIYDLERPTTIKNNQTKQINFVEAAGVKAEKEYLVTGQTYFWSRSIAGQKPKHPVNVFVKFKNAKENNLGIPLPEGVMRFYKEDHDGSLQFVGEDRIEHTPKDEEVRMKLGEAFDLVAEREQMDFRQVTKNRYESEWEITLRNHKEEDVVITVSEPVNGSWEVLRSSHEYEKVNAQTLEFKVPVPKDGEVKLTYRVSVGY